MAGWGAFVVMGVLPYRSQLLLPIIVAGLAALAGCSKLSYCCPSTSVLLTQSEAESISGLEMEMVYDIRDSQRSSRSFNGRMGVELYSVTLDLHRFGENGGPTNEAGHREVALKYGRVENVGGIGESSFLSSVDDGELQLYARKGAFGFQLHTKSVLPPNIARERLIAAAQLVANRIE
jgi:hypothetical protein